MLVFFLPFVVITASYAVVTYRIWSYSRATASSLKRARNSRARSNGSSCGNGYFLAAASDPGAANAEDEDETAVYEMKVIS